MTRSACREERRRCEQREEGEGEAGDLNKELLDDIIVDDDRVSP
jgi:hypothetical protein